MDIAMALPLSFGFPLSSSTAPYKPTHTSVSAQPQPATLGSQSLSHPRFNSLAVISSRRRRRRRRNHFIINAIEEGGRQDKNESETVTTQQQSPSEEPQSETNGEVSELGSEIRKALKEREGGKEGGDLWGGVAEEIGEIEWPAFGKVLGTTWVVLGVIAGSSVALLTVNAILAELSDRVFAGRGVQDFFGS